MNQANNSNAKGRKKVKLLLMMFVLLTSLSPTFANKLSSTIQGLVTDPQNVPLAGVTIMEKGTSNGCITDVNGLFNLKASVSNPKIVFSFLGYVRHEVQIAQETYIKVVMEDESKDLDDVVVVGYGTRRKGGISASVSSINSKDLSRSTSTTTAGALVGKVAGITNRQKSGTPGSSSNLQIRNFGTPLYVIDGVIEDAGNFNNIDINDIDNISVLKDGAAAIYGVKAANGVILVTTKTGGLNQKPQVNVNAYTGWQQWTKYPELLNAYQWEYANYMKEVNSGTLGVTKEFAQAELEKWKTGLYDATTGEDYRGYNWKDAYVSKAAPQKYINASVSVGNERTTAYFSLSHVDQDAVFKDYNFNRTNFQSNVSTKINDNLKVGFQTMARIETRQNPGLPGTDDYALIKTSLLGLQPIYRPYANENPLYLNYIQGNDARNMAAFDTEHAGTFKSVWRTLQNTFNLDYKTPVKGLTAKGLFSYYYANNAVDNNEQGWKEYTYNRTSDTYDVKYDKAASGETFLVRTKEAIQDMTGTFTLNYDTKIGENHHITGLAGFEFYDRQYNSLTIQQNPVENPFIDLMSTNENNSVNEAKFENSTASFIFRGGYDYKQKYILDFGGRYDGSWKFPKGKRWGFFPTVSAAWRISDENFLKNSSVSTWLTNLKLRASYGEMGDDNLGGAYPDFAFQSGYNYGSGSASIPTDPTQSSDNKLVVGSKLKDPPTTGISWMTTSITNIGLEVGFLNNRLSAEVDAFKRLRNGIPAMPNDVVFPLESGLLTKNENLNSDEHMGIDGMIKWNDHIGDFRYFVGVNATFSRQRNSKVYGELFFNALDKYYNSTSDRWTNVSSGQVWMWQSVGTFKTQEQIDNYPVNVDGQNNTTLSPGDVIFKDLNGDGIIDNSDKRPLGYASVDWPWDSSKGNKNPLLSTGLNFGFDWKGIDFAADFAGGFLNTFVPDWYMKWGVSRSSNSYVYNSLDVWHHEDIFDPQSPWIEGKFPALRASNPSTRGENNYYSKNVNYVRLRNLVLGYTIPKKLTFNRIQKFRVYFEGTNLFCWDTLKDYNIDPETSTVNGTDYPQSRVYSIGVNLTF